MASQFFFFVPFRFDEQKKSLPINSGMAVFHLNLRKTSRLSSEATLNSGPQHYEPLRSLILMSIRVTIVVSRFELKTKKSYQLPNRTNITVSVWPKDKKTLTILKIDITVSVYLKRKKYPPVTKSCHSVTFRSDKRVE